MTQSLFAKVANRTDSLLAPLGGRPSAVFGATSVTSYMRGGPSDLMTTLMGFSRDQLAELAPDASNAPRLGDIEQALSTFADRVAATGIRNLDTMAAASVGIIRESAGVGPLAEYDRMNLIGFGVSRESVSRIETAQETVRLSSRAELSASFEPSARSASDSLGLNS